MRMKMGRKRKILIWGVSPTTRPGAAPCRPAGAACSLLTSRHSPPNAGAGVQNLHRQRVPGEPSEGTDRHPLSGPVRLQGEAGRGRRRRHRARLQRRQQGAPLPGRSGPGHSRRGDRRSTAAEAIASSGQRYYSNISALDRAGLFY